MANDRFLVDSSVWIFALRKDPIPPIRDRVAALLRDDAVVTTGVIKLEILTGAKTEREYTRLKSRLDALESLQTDERVWQTACRHGFTLRRQGMTIPTTDLLIATCALQAGVVVVHADAHFDLMSGPLGLRTESHVRLLKKALS